jgi:hypothetical protein
LAQIVTASLAPDAQTRRSGKAKGNGIKAAKEKGRR